MITDFGRRERKRRKSAEFGIIVVDGRVSVKGRAGAFFGGIVDAIERDLFTLRTFASNYLVEIEINTCASYMMHSKCPTIGGLNIK